MKKPLSEILSEALAIVEKATPGELSVYDANEGDGWPPRPLWCFKNEAYDSEDEEAEALQGSVHYGGKEDAEAIAVAINLLRQHGHALAALARRVEGAAVGRVPRSKIGDMLLFPVSHDLAGKRVRLVPEGD